MSEKLVAGIVTAVAITPICAVCILGPAAIGLLFAGAFGWLGGFNSLATLALMIAAGALVYRHFLRRRARALPNHEVSTDAGSPAKYANVGRSQVPDSGAILLRGGSTGPHIQIRN
jgi:hypothetical protein